jgi:hypothetical protein
MCHPNGNALEGNQTSPIGWQQSLGAPLVLMKRTFFHRVALVILVAVSVILIGEIGSFFYFDRLISHHNVLTVFERLNQTITVKKNYFQEWKTSEFTTTVRTNNIGLREDREYHGEKIDIGFYGDSFTFGHGVNAGERYSDRLREWFPGKVVVSFGYLDGWTLPQYYFFTKQHPELVPDIAILGLFLGNDLSSDMEEIEVVLAPNGELISAIPKRRDVHPQGFLVTKGDNPIGNFLRKFWIGRLLLRFRTLAPTAASSEPNAPNPLSLEKGELSDLSLAALGYVRQMDRELKLKDKRLVVFLIPCGFQVGDYISPYDAGATRDLRENLYLPKAVVSWCLENQIECVNPIPHFQDLERKGTRLYYRMDAHWNPQGHKAASEVLLDYLNER